MPPAQQIALTRLGFRPFFLCGSLFAVISMGVWLSIIAFGANPVAIPPVLWHGHEMVFGYALAVVAGFLLTAVRNWTGIQTLRGTPLILLVLLWLLARLVPFVGSDTLLPLMMALDLAFNTGLCLAILHPIIKGGHHKSLGVWFVLVALTVSNLLFYLGLLGQVANGAQTGLQSGLYFVIFLILLLGRRVLPMFITNGVGYPVTLTNRRWLDISCLLLMLLFIVVEVFVPQPALASLCAGLLFLLHAIRISGWYTAGIWKKSLLWVLYLAYGWIIVGFAIVAVAYPFGFNPKIALHAFAYGGIGLMTIGMMARVSLGHTGRNVAAPPAILTWAFMLLLIGCLSRVVMPVIIPGWHMGWIVTAQGVWIAAFALFVSRYAVMWLQPRIDGRDG